MLLRLLAWLWMVVLVVVRLGGHSQHTPPSPVWDALSHAHSEQQRVWALLHSHARTHEASIPHPYRGYYQSLLVDPHSFLHSVALLQLVALLLLPPRLTMASMFIAECLGAASLIGTSEYASATTAVSLAGCLVLLLGLLSPSSSRKRDDAASRGKDPSSALTKGKEEVEAAPVVPKAPVIVHKKQTTHIYLRLPPERLPRVLSSR